MRKWERAELRIETMSGAALTDALPALAALRIEVFRDFPYLYDGDPDYERDYIAGFIASKGSVIVAARDGETIIGASTAIPMAEAEEEWRAPFISAGRDISGMLYCGESVLRRAYRGLGIGHSFFDSREAHGQRMGLNQSCFCAVIRPQNHPATPQGYRPLEGFWRKRGYAPLDGIVAEFAWKDLGDDDETPKRLQFWHRMSRT